MRAALDATSLVLSSGGLPRYVTELSLALAREFPEDTYTLVSDQAFQMPEGAPSNLLHGPQTAARQRWWLWGLRKVLHEIGAEVFHGTNFEVPYLGATPSVLTLHDLSPWRNPEWHHAADRVRKRTPWLIRLKRARMILTVSEAVRREVIEFFGIPSHNVRAVHLAASSAFAPIACPPAERPFFLFVGTLEPRKNLAGLIEAWRATRTETGADLFIAGRRRSDFTGNYEDPGLHFLGEVQDAELPYLYATALAFVYPSHYEGFGLPVLEAMQSGCPVITSTDPAIKEVSGGAALHTDSPLDLANALRNVAVHPLMRDDMRRAGFARAKCFSWSATARATRAVYAEALA